MDTESSASKPRRNIKDSSCVSDGRRRREATSVRLREERKLDTINKKRAMYSEAEEAGMASAAAVTMVNVPSELALEHVPAYVAAVNSDKLELQLEGVVQLRRLLSKEANPPAAAIIATGVLPRLVALMTVPDSRMQFEAAWAITNVASTDYTAAVVEAGAIGPLCAGLVSPDANVREQCIWCIGNIVGDCVKFRDAVMYAPGALHGLLLNISEPASDSLLRNAAWALSNFARGKPGPSAEAVTALLPALSHLLKTSTDKAVLTDMVWGINYITDNEKYLDTALAAGVLPRVVELAGAADANVSTAAVRILGNFISGTEQHTQAAIDAGALRALMPLLSSPRRNTRREATWAISNVAAGSKAQITVLMTLPGLMPAILAQLKDNDWNIRKEAAWVVCNVAAAGTSEHVRQLVSLGVVSPLNDVLATNDPRMLCVVLDAVSAILATGRKLCEGGMAAACDFAAMFEEVGILDRLEELQDHDNRDVTSKCVDIIEKFYGVAVEGVPDENIMATAPRTPQAPPSLFAGASALGFSTPTGMPKTFGAAAAAPGGMPFGSAQMNGGIPLALPQPVHATQSFGVAYGVPLQAAHGFGAPLMAAPIAAAPPGGGFDFSGVAFV